MFVVSTFFNLAIDCLSGKANNIYLLKPSKYKC